VTSGAKRSARVWRWARWVVPIAIILAAVVIWLIGTALTAPTNYAVNPAPPPAQRVTIRTPDGLAIAGSYWPSAETSASASAPAVLLLHGNGSNRHGIGPIQRWLSDGGFAVLAIDFRGHGESDASAKSFGWFEAVDAHAALAWLRTRHPSARIGVYGASLGGSAALVGAQGPVRADALALNAVFPDIRTAVYNRIAEHSAPPLAAMVEPLLTYQSRLRLGLSPDQIAPVRAIRLFRGPVMVIGGGADIYTPPNETRALFNAAAQPDGLWILDGLSHDQAVGDPPEALRVRLLAFFDRHLRTAR
jgi:uncharacterized protein